MDSDGDLRNWHVAKDIATKAGVIKDCDSHPGAYTVIGDPQTAYMMANNWMTANDPLVSEFKTRKELTDTIKSVIDEAADVCPQCEKEKHK